MEVVGRYKQLLDYFNDNNSFIQLTDDDVIECKREYNTIIKKAFTWIYAEKDVWTITCEHQGEGNLGYDNQEITITMKKKSSVSNFFGEDRSKKSLNEAIMNMFKK